MTATAFGCLVLIAIEIKLDFVRGLSRISTLTLSSGITY